MKIKRLQILSNVWKRPRRVQCLVGPVVWQRVPEHQRTHDGRRCWAGSAARRVDDCWQSADADETWRWKLAGSGLSDTGGLILLAFGREAYRACTWVALDHQANGQWSSVRRSRDRPQLSQSLMTRAVTFNTRSSCLLFVSAAVVRRTFVLADRNSSLNIFNFYVHHFA